MKKAIGLISMPLLLIFVIGLSFSSCKKEDENNSGNNNNNGSNNNNGGNTTDTTVKDVDGNIYKTVKIGNQVWMAQNLRVKKFNNGDLIAHVPDFEQWKGLTTAAWSNYNNNPSFDSLYGKIYNYFAVSDVRKLCPSGWHVPTNAEWNSLETFLGLDSAGAKMKAKTDWKNTANGNNKSGFSAYPAGYRTFAFDANYVGMGSVANWWINKIPSEMHMVFNLISDDVRSDRVGSDVTNGNSVRCVKD